MDAQQLIAYAKTIDIELSADDCAEIIATSYPGETVEEAVWDFLDAYEGISHERRAAHE
jgi:hypothetical protein